MKSHFEGYTKCFIKACLLDHTAMEEKQSILLMGKKAKYPLHITMAVLHIAPDTPCTAYLRGSEFAADLADLVTMPSSLSVNRPSYLLMGGKPVSFTITMDVVDDALTLLVVNTKRRLCDFLCEKFNLVCNEVLFADKYPYYVLSYTDDDNRPILKMSITDSPVLCHVTLFNSFDLARCNKALSKKFVPTETEMALLCGPVEDLIGDVLCLAPTLVIEH